ncbi:septum site-determining protein MinC [Simonsiella muelleri ATCC 29453]|nr:septum site-determining protein MinC [Simonsiella muelleri ATCC 29453]
MNDADNDILMNDNDAIKTVEMAEQQADLVEISAEEARRIAESMPSELSGQVGEAKGEIVSISEAKQTIVVSTPVRTGQQIYAEKADLIVLGIVSPGAEVIADGNIHIYAPLRGRALAGASGDRKARIFVQSMQAELVSIAGIYRTFEQKLPQHLHKQPVRIELQDDRLAISSIVAE